MTNALEIRNLTKTYPGFRLDDLSLTLPSGCILGLIGENGAGKSTTIRLILDMIQKDSGSVVVLGSEKLNKEEIGVVPDEVGIPDCLTPMQLGKVMSHIYKTWDMEKYNGLLDRFALPRSKAFGDFSRGMKMKLGITVALSHASRLLILDEATGGLDPVVRDEVLEMFEDFTRDEDHSILLSSHIVSDLEKVCDYIAFLHKGKLLLCEEKDRLLEEYGILLCAPDDLPAEGVCYKKESRYGVEAIVRRDAMPADAKLSPISIEELFIFMAKEA